MVLDDVMNAISVLCQRYVLETNKDAGLVGYLASVVNVAHHYDMYQLVRQCINEVKASDLSRYGHLLISYMTGVPIYNTETFELSQVNRMLAGTTFEDPRMGLIKENILKAPQRRFWVTAQQVHFAKDRWSRHLYPALQPSGLQVEALGSRHIGSRSSLGGVHYNTQSIHLYQNDPEKYPPRQQTHSSLREQPTYELEPGQESHSYVLEQSGHRLSRLQTT